MDNRTGGELNLNNDDLGYQPTDQCPIPSECDNFSDYARFTQSSISLCFCACACLKSEAPLGH